MEKFIWKNQQLIAQKQAQISIDERGFLFGDGLFETYKIFNGKIYDFVAHQSRIIKGLRVLKFDAEIKDLEKKSLQLIAKNQVENGLLKISISRGIGSAGYQPTYESEPLIIIQTLSSRTLPQKITLGISTQVVPMSNLGKTQNALPYILAKIAANEKNFFDCVMLSPQKFIAETSSANIFWVKNGKVFTPAKACGILLGCVRKKLLKIAPQKIKIKKAKISALKNADEIFLTNSSFLLLPVDEFLGQKLQKNLGNQLLKLLQNDVEKSCKK